MTQTSPTLHMMCGKIAAGKSTLAKRLSGAPLTVLISEDDWLATLFEGEIRSGADYQNCATKLRAIMGPHIASLLASGLSVVLDFPANTVANRAWMRNVLNQSGAAHVLHVLDVADAICLARLQARNQAGAHAFAATEAQYWQFAKYYQPPSPEEGFHVIVHSETETG